MVIRSGPEGMLFSYPGAGTKMIDLGNVFVNRKVGWLKFIKIPGYCF